MGTKRKVRLSGRLSHVDSAGNARMVNVGSKPLSARVAVAEGFVTMSPATLAAIARGSLPKGDVFACARIAAIQAAKRCDSLIPLCHTLPLDAVEVRFELPKASSRARVRIEAAVFVTARTGVEMEALTAVTVAALTIYDMCKAIDKSMTVDGIRLVSKTKTPLQ